MEKKLTSIHEDAGLAQRVKDLELLELWGRSQMRLRTRDAVAVV